MAYAWITDIHLDFISRDIKKLNAFYDSLKPYKGVIISGDISNSASAYHLLVGMYRSILKPIYFVLGNHDYYGIDVAGLRDEMRHLKDEPDLDSNVIYLTQSEIFIELAPGVQLCGVDGWADARAGDFDGSSIRLNDSNYIADLRNAERLGGKHVLKQMMQKLSDEDTYRLDNDIEQIMNAYGDTKEIIVVTHVPPFPECCLYQNRPSGKDFLPFFCNVNLGTMLYTKAILYPDVQFTVLCGHTHGKCDPFDKLSNLKIRVGGAEYYQPEIAGEILNDI